MQGIAFSRIYGNKTLLAYLSAAIAENTLPHALILTGDTGSGKRTLALEIACAMGGAEAEEKIRGGNCPDIVTVELPADRKSIGVETARNIRAQASTVPNDLPFRLFIVCCADAFTVQAQNALLKILEEPNGSTYFLLLCENENSIIPTVRSRAPVLAMQHFSENEIDAYLSETVPEAKRLKREDEQAYRYLLRLSNGCIGQAIAALRERASDDPSKTACELLQTLAQGDRVIWLCRVDKLTADRDKLQTVFAALRRALRDLILVKSVLMRQYSAAAAERVGKGLLCFTDADSAMALSGQFTMRALLLMEQAVRNAADDAGRMANVSNLKQKWGAEMRTAAEL